MRLSAAQTSEQYGSARRAQITMMAVFPALVPGSGYQDLAIQDGGQASLTFTQMIGAETEEEEREGHREALLAYCHRDTEAMVQIFDAPH